MEFCEDFIPTRGSKNKQSTENQFQLVSYNSHKTKKEKKANSEPNNEEFEKNNVRNNIFNIKQARHEVIKYGMSGFDTQEKKKAKIELAIKLGAKPRKNKYKNYKLLLEEKKAEKKNQESMEKFQQLGKNSVGKSIAKGKSFDRKRRKGKDNILDIYGKVKVKTVS